MRKNDSMPMQSRLLRDAAGFILDD